MSENNLDEILEKLGTWGRFQILYYICLCFAVIYTVCPMSYIFTARDIKYSCLTYDASSNDPNVIGNLFARHFSSMYVPDFGIVNSVNLHDYSIYDVGVLNELNCTNVEELWARWCFIPVCDKNSSEYDPIWLKDVVPYKDNIPNRCLRYGFETDTCPPENMNKNKTVICQNFVYERMETTIVHDFVINCDSNLWKLTMVGTINVIGELVCLSYSGFVSDRFGRSKIMTISILVSCFVGTIKSFSSSYSLFIFLEFLETSLCSATYGAAFILAMELVPHDQRNIGNTIISCVFSIGQMILGLVAWLAPTWRVMLRVLYIPGLISISFFWTVPESIRWLIYHRRQEEAKAILLKITKVNKNVLEEETIKAFLDKFPNSEKNTVEKKETFKKAITNKVLFIRTICCSYIWICCVFVYYGLTIHSVNISDNIYVSFIFTVAIEIPAYVIYYFVNEKVGRRKIMFATLLFGGILCLVDGYIPEGYIDSKLIAFLAGKCCLTIAYTVLYVYTTEIFPTSSRHTMFSICSMFGRFGSMVAPQIPLLARISKSLPLLMFGILSATSGCLSLFLPETLNAKLPDTIEEAVNIGKIHLQIQDEEEPLKT